MSLIELILNDRRLWLATGVALAPLGLAVLLWLAVQVRRFAQVRAARRAADYDARFLAEHGLLASPEDQEGSGEAHPATATSHPPVAATAYPGETVEEDGEEEEAAPEGDGEVVNSAMQDLLNSVFNEEEYTNRFEHLMDELDDIRAADLASLCDDIARHLS
ncbi:MAG: hypothetical protein AB1435_17495 [Chloroflexota bacterium]